MIFYVERTDEKEMTNIFCIPGAGASAVMFLPWMKDLQGREDVKACMLEIPGRGMRKKDQSMKTMEELVDALLKKIDIQLKDEDEYVLYGYCFGAIIAYEMCREMERRGMRLPAQLFFSSIGSPESPKIAEPVFKNTSFQDEIRQMFIRYFPPQLFSNTESLQRITAAFTDRVFEKFAITGRLENVTLEELGEELVQLSQKEENIDAIMKFANEALQTFEYDQEMLLNFANGEKKDYLLPVPVTVMRGIEDTLTEQNDLEMWRDFCKDDFRAVTVCGNHFTFEESKDEILNVILDAVDNMDSVMIFDI